MPNLVSITIAGEDRTGPAFASVMARGLALKSALKDIGTIGLDVNTSSLAPKLMAIRSLIRSLGIADIADVNVDPGKIATRLQLIKNEIQRQHISDLLDVNVNKAQLAGQLAVLKGLSATIPVNFDVSNLPHIGNISDQLTVQGVDTATRQLAALQAQTQLVSDGFARASDAKDKFSTNVTGTLTPAVNAAAGRFGFLKNHISLFGGALGAVPFIGTVTGLHLVLDSIVEVAAELVPAAIAFGAFAAAAVPAIMSIYSQEKALYTVSQAFNQQMPGMSGNFQKVAAAVQPEVYILFGEALNTMNRNTGTFMTLATGAGHVLDELGARAEIALGSKGVSSFAQKAVDDLQVLGNIIGNVFGIFGNLLKVMPGYAEILFHALQDVTGALEAITSNSIVQGILSIGLSLHGFIVWGGLAATAAVALGNSIAALGVRMGLLSAGTTMFDGAAFANGLSQAAGGAALLSKEMITLGAGEDIAAAGALSLEGVMAAVSAVNPVVWIAAAIGAIAGLVMWLGNMKSASQQAFDSLQKQLSDASTFTSAFATITEGVQQANSALSYTPKYITATQVGMHGMTRTFTELNPAWQQLTANAQTWGAQQGTLTSRMDALNKITGSQANSLAALNQIGAKAGDIATESASAFKNQEVQIQALTSATTQLAGFTSGEAAAAQNALTNSFLSGTLPAIQKVTQAEDALMTTITGSTTAMDAFQLGMATLQQNLQAVGGKAGTASHSLDGMKSSASLLGATLGGTTQADYALSQAFYSQVGSAQKVIDALMQQSASTKNLTTVTATMAGQMLTYAGTNTAARSVIVDLINNALGPNTVSLQNLNTWVGHNSTSLQGLNSIIAESTVKAGTLAGVLQSDLNAQFQQALLKSSGADQAITALTTAITHGGMQTSAYAGARAQLIKDLENAGMSAHDATGYVDGLQAKINAMHGKSVNVNVVGSGSGTITFAEQNIKNAQTGYLEFHAAGGPVGGSGGPTQDNIPIMASSGEYVMQASAVNKYGTGFMSAVNAGKFAGGGLVGGYGIFSGVGQDFIGTAEHNAAQSVAQAAALAMYADMKAKVAAQAAAVSSVTPAGTAGGTIAAMMKSMAAMRGWTGSQWDALYAVEMREAGFNMNATNPSSGAYGLAQFINGPSEYAQYGGNFFTAAGQITGMLNYIAQRYGTPAGAWAHEVNFGWYDKGGWLKPGWTMAYNGTGSPEPVGGAASGGLHITLELGDSFRQAGLSAQQLEDIRYTVRTKGGGNVQSAFGIA